MAIPISWCECDFSALPELMQRSIKRPGFHPDVTSLNWIPFTSPPLSVAGLWISYQSMASAIRQLCQRVVCFWLMMFNVQHRGERPSLASCCLLFLLFLLLGCLKVHQLCSVPRSLASTELLPDINLYAFHLFVFTTLYFHPACNPKINPNRIIKGAMD